ncbi:MAG: lysoplasmalogenase [Acidimicrobiales bacterium]
MTGAAFLLLTLAFVVAAGDWHAVFHGNKPLEYLCKPLTMVLLFGAALALDPADPTVRAWFLVAIALCLVGDVLLMVPKDMFVLGLGSFLLGHLAYIGGLVASGVDGPRLAVGTGIVVVALLLIGRRIMQGVQRGAEPELTGPVLSYMAVISVMVASAIGSGSAWATAGAVSFYASDALIAWNRFLRETAYGRLVIIVTYHVAQVGLVLSLI